MNIEGMYSARRELLCRTACREPFCRTVYFIKKIEQSETTLRHSAVRHSAVLRFAVQIPNRQPLHYEPLNPEPLLTLNLYLMKPFFTGSQNDGFFIVQILGGYQLVEGVNSMAVHISAPLLDEPSCGTI